MTKFVLLVVLMGLLAAGPAAGLETSSGPLESQALQHLKEGRGHAREKRYARAVADLQLAVALAERADQENLTLALALHNLAEIYRLQGERVNALHAYERALAIYKALDHKQAIAIAENQIRALLSNSKEGHTATAGASHVAASTPTPAVENRLSKIDSAVERIRRRLRSKNSPRSTRAVPSPMAPASIELSEAPSLALASDRRAYAESVKDKIQGGWRYPPSAKNKHEEGTVEVGLEILRSGELENIDILKSSGFVTLDMESIRSVREAGPFGPIALPEKEDQISLRLLFNYKLPTPKANTFKAQAPGSPASR